ncbi:hypothetical protein K1719_014358 [Acacia pycnantha]|nr:hypothetical protein K1719_014358 [Acacia pycnantha]
MAFWTDEKVKRRVLVEKRSKKGLLLHGKPRQPLPQASVPLLPQASVPPSTSFDPDTMLTHPVVRTTYTRLLSNLQQEMLALQHTLSEEGNFEGDAPNNQPTTSEESDDDDEDGHDIEEGDDMDEGDQPENIIDVEEIPQHGEETPHVDTPHVDGGLGREQEVKEPGLELRRSQRVIIPSSVLKSPWINPKRKSKGKRTYDEKDTLFEMCTKSVSEDEAAEEFVDMHHYFLTREELQCLNPRQWINNKLMTMVAKTLVADQLENGGVVHRHIFTADFMSKMISAERKWTVQSNVAEILPEHVGYNIGDCHFLFGPTLSKSLVLLFVGYENHGFLCS